MDKVQPLPLNNGTFIGLDIDLTASTLKFPAARMDAITNNICAVLRACRITPRDISQATCRVLSCSHLYFTGSLYGRPLYGRPPRPGGPGRIIRPPAHTHSMS